MTVYPLDDLLSPVTTAELADFLGAEPGDPLFTGVLMTATDMLITHMQRDINPRNWRLIVQEPQRVERQIHRQRQYPDWIEIPYGATAIESVTDKDNEPLDYVVDLESIPGRLFVDTRKLYRVDFTAGMYPVPESVKEAVKAMAAFLYEHRGHCEADDAIRRSGAGGMVKRYRIERL